MSLSPVSLEREHPAVFESIGKTEPQWQRIANGIDYFHGKTASPKLEFWALQIDLSEPELRIIVKGGGHGSNDRQAFNTKVSSFTRDNNLIAGINAVPFDVASSKEGRPVQNMGIVISGGEMLAPVNTRYDALVFYIKNEGAAIVSQASIASIENIENAAGGFHQILARGETTERTSATEVRHPRSAAGISADGKRLYLLAIDGRRSGSFGATELETAQLLHSLGSHDGINFDGGGSTALALRHADGKVRIANTPIHKGIRGRERAVAGCLGIKSD